ncbi:MAG: zf-TFIIB domain-containing protein [Thermoanaerobaculia bacterium]|nr:zf-TFIIB domain-containing protein [Thermoanaerobaculia bacterium]
MPVNPSDSEKEYFLKLELEKLRKLQEESAARMKEETKKKLKELHWMNCPKCGMDLKEVEYQNVKVDYCGSCGGSFFDAGEIEQRLKLGEEQNVLGKFLKVFKR